MAIAEQTLRAVIEIEDRTAAALHAINQRFARAAAPIHHIGHGLSELAEESGLRTIGERAERAGEHLRRLRERAVDILPALSALGGIVSVAGLAEIIKSSGEYGEHLLLTSRATGLSAPQLGGLEYAGKLAGVGQEQLDRGIEYLNRTIAEAARGKNKDAELIFSRMGLVNTPTHMLKSAESLAAVSNEAKKLVESGQVQLATDMMSKLFGSRSGVLLLPAFQQGWAHVSELMEEARRHGLALTDEQAKRAAEFQESFKQLGSAIQGTELTIADKLYPTLTPIIERMTEWLDVNRDWIATRIGAEFRDIAETLRSIDWGPALAGAKFLGQGALWAANHLRVVEAVLAAIAIVKLGGVIRDLGLLSAAVVGFAARSGAAAMSLLPTLGPAGLIVAGLTAIGVGAYEVYQHWDSIAPLLENIWTRMGDTGAAAWHKIQDAADMAWNDFKAFADWLKDHLPEWVVRLWTGGAAGDAAGAGAGSSGPLLPGRQAGPLPAERADLARRLVDEAQRRGVDRAHAIAMLGNASAESGLNAGALGDYENGIPTSFGLFQEHDTRMRDMLRTLGARAKDPVAQLDYAIDEMRRRDPGWFNRSDDLTNSFERSFERPKNVVDRSSFSDRIASALEKPIGRTSSAAGAKARGQVDVNVTVDHRNAPPGVTTRVEQPDPLDLDLGQAFAW